MNGCGRRRSTGIAPGRRARRSVQRSAPIMNGCGRRRSTGAILSIR